MYLSTLCDDDIQGKKSLHAAMNTIFSVPISETPENSSNDKSEDTEVKPTLLWSALYIQEMTTVCFSFLSSTTKSPPPLLPHIFYLDSACSNEFVSHFFLSPFLASIKFTLLWTGLYFSVISILGYSSSTHTSFRFIRLSIMC